MAESTIFIWCWPATGATVLGKCLSNVEDVEYWHDPYWNCYNVEQLGDLKMDSLSPELQRYFAKIREAAVPAEGKQFYEGSESLPSETFK